MLCWQQILSYIDVNVPIAFFIWPEYAVLQSVACKIVKRQQSTEPTID